MTVAFSAGDAAYWGLAIFLVLLGVGSIFALYKLGRCSTGSRRSFGEQSATCCRSSSRRAVPSTASTTSSTSSTR